MRGHRVHPGCQIIFYLRFSLIARIAKAACPILKRLKWKWEGILSRCQFTTFIEFHSAESKLSSPLVEFYIKEIIVCSANYPWPQPTVRFLFWLAFRYLDFLHLNWFTSTWCSGCVGGWTFEGSLRIVVEAGCGIGRGFTHFRHSNAERRRQTALQPLIEAGTVITTYPETVSPAV